MRVSQRQMFNNSVYNMNRDLSALMESNIQSSSQKKINRPSDDPNGASMVQIYRNSLSNIKMYQDNQGTAQGWLSAADGVLDSVHENLTRIFTLAEQSATGTLTDQQREDASFEIRERFKQLISLANTQYGDGSYIFAGHKTGQAPFAETLAVTCNDAALAGEQYTVAGGSASTILVQFRGSGALSGHPAFEYTTDKGKTWQTGTWNGDKLVAGGAEVSFSDMTANVAQADPANVNEKDNGTWLYIRPSAEYKGDDNDTQVVKTYPVGGAGPTGAARGAFSQDVAVRVDQIAGGVVNYSYSLDDGKNWIAGSAPDAAPYNLPIPGGFLDLSGQPAAGDQFIVRPRRADINLEIASHTNITINLIGKDVFGGLYKEPFSTNGAQPVFGGDARNIFEVVGRLVGYTETNSQRGVQECLEALKTAMTTAVTARTNVGGRLNRLEIAAEQMENYKMSEEDALSGTEDVDVTELMTRLAQQQLAYNSVLKSSAMIMQMNLMNFL